MPRQDESHLQHLMQQHPHYFSSPLKITPPFALLYAYKSSNLIFPLFYHIPRTHRILCLNICAIKKYPSASVFFSKKGAKIVHFPPRFLPFFCLQATIYCGQFLFFVLLTTIPHQNHALNMLGVALIAIKSTFPTLSVLGKYPHS